MPYNEAILRLPMPDRIKRLPVSAKGFPVPWFVQWIDNGRAAPVGTGEPDFRIMDAGKFARALHTPLCWICGDLLGQHRVFTIGPMCSVNRVISEPPSHRECAEYAMVACPFLANPRARRNVKDLPEDGKAAAGYHIDRNPGAMALWECRDYKPFHAHAGSDGVLFRLGDPVRVDWYCAGRRATRAEVLHSIDTGYPHLMQLAKDQGQAAIEELTRARAKIDALLPIKEDNA